MQNSLTEQDVETLRDALAAWEVQPSSETMMSIIVGGIFAGVEKGGSSIEAHKKQLAKATADQKQRKETSVLLQAKLIQALRTPTSSSGEVRCDDGLSQAAKDPIIGGALGGGIFAGMTELDGKPAHLVLLPDEAQEVSWDQAMKWAEIRGAALPTRAEQQTLFQNLKSEFAERWYWSGEQLTSLPSGAWHQDFFGGTQYYDHKSYEGRARAVRRLPI